MNQDTVSNEKRKTFNSIFWAIATALAIVGTVVGIMVAVFIFLLTDRVYRSSSTFMVEVIDEQGKSSSGFKYVEILKDPEFVRFVVEKNDLDEIVDGGKVSQDDVPYHIMRNLTIEQGKEEVTLVTTRFDSFDPWDCKIILTTLIVEMTEHGEKQVKKLAKPQESLLQPKPKFKLTMLRRPDEGEQIAPHLPKLLMMCMPMGLIGGLILTFLFRPIWKS